MGWYLPDEVIVADGALSLRARERTSVLSDGTTYNYSSGLVQTGRNNSDLSSPPRFEFTYGFVEARAIVPAGQGFWPAFWLLPSDHNSEPEIDILEILGDDPRRAHHHYHRDGKDTGTSWVGPDFSQDWHTFAVDWQPGRIVWYVDGIERFRYEGSDVSDEPMYILANLAVGGHWPGPPDETTAFPAIYSIDYIRVWQ